MQVTLMKLGIESCSSTLPTDVHNPGFFMMPNVLTAWVGEGDDAVQFCESFLADDLGSSKVAKLRRGESPLPRGAAAAAGAVVWLRSFPPAAPSCHQPAGEVGASRPRSSSQAAVQFADHPCRRQRAADPEVAAHPRQDVSTDTVLSLLLAT
jgi:hypothetical protein